MKENQPNILIGKLGFKNNQTNSVKFSIANQKDVTDMIAITSDGTLHTLQSLDREVRDVYRLTVIAEYNKGNNLFYRLDSERLFQRIVRTNKVEI